VPAEKVSIIIINYNYDKYVGDAINSALNTLWFNKEIIIVDDGSTDGSRAVIRSFGEKVVCLFKENGGQISGANLAIQHATGKVIFFLDSDDRLRPDAVEKVMAAWSESVSKVQFPLELMTPDGTRTGEMYPNFIEWSPERIRASVNLTGFYLSSPTSGNAWSKAFLDKIFPLPTDHERIRFFDGYLSRLAPFFGDVVTVGKPLADYRINPANMWTMRFSPALVVENCIEDIETAELISRKLIELGIQVCDGMPIMTPSANYAHMMKRLVWRRFLRESYFLEQANPFRIVRQTWTTLRLDPTVNSRTRLILLLWFLLVAFLPRFLAIYPIKMRFVPLYRPAWIRLLLIVSGWRGRVR
jgi:glycosyltransferase involved in cell wall biosynthesis